MDDNVVRADVVFASALISSCLFGFSFLLFRQHFPGDALCFFRDCFGRSAYRARYPFAWSAQCPHPARLCVGLESRSRAAHAFPWWIAGERTHSKFPLVADDKAFGYA